MNLKTKLIGAFAGAVAVAGVGFHLIEDYNYSNGARQGQITKLSNKGILCKTWEGEAAMINFAHSGARGSTNEGTDNTFYFSVDDDEVAQKIKDSMNNGDLVNLEYEQKLFPLANFIFCQRRTEYEVTNVIILNNENAVRPPLAPAMERE